VATRGRRSPEGRLGQAVSGPAGASTNRSGGDEAVVARLGELSRQFADNLTAATRDFAWHTSTESELAGLHPRDLERARRKAQASGVEGFLITLDAHSVAPALANLEDRALRKALYEAYTTRASDRGPRAGRFDNTAILSEMLELRHELARMSGFRNYAALALADGVFPDPDQAERALVVAHRGTRGQAQAELDTLWAFAKEKGVPRGFAVWDLPFYAAWWQREELGFDADQVREYLDLNASIEGALTFARDLLHLTLTPLPPATAPGGTHHGYRVSERDGAPLGLLLLDVFGPDPWVSEERVRLLDERVDGLPVVAVECGFEAPWGDGPIQLAHSDLRVLFRCVGRALHLLLTRAGAQPGHAPPQALLGSEVAGHLLERFASNYETLQTFARHCDTGSPLPRDLFSLLVRSNSAHAGLATSAALELELFDLRIHRDHVPSAKSTQLRVQVLDTFTQVRREQSVLPPAYWTRFANSSTAIFVHGRGARLWERDLARRLSAELYAALETTGFSGETTRRLREGLFAAGGQGVVQRLAASLDGAPPLALRH
jgi:oligopeptidase A